MAKARKDNKGRVLRKGECQRKDNSYLYAYTDPFGRRRYIYAQTLQELREREDALKKDQLDGLDTYAASRATVNSVFDRYIAMKLNLRSSTQANYKYTYDKFVRETFGKRKIAEIKFSDVKFFYCYLMTEKGLSVASVDNVHTLLHPTFQLAVRDDVIRKNPSDGVMAELKKSGKKKKRMRHGLTAEQQKAFIEYVRKDEVFKHWAPLFTVLFGTGCRVGEAIGIRWQDIDFEKRLLTIDHQLTYYPRGDKRRQCFRVETPKTEAGIRDIPMMDAVVSAFREEMEIQQATGFNKTVIDGMSGFVFQSSEGGLQHPGNINKAIRRIVTRHNEQELIEAQETGRNPVIIPPFSCHITRHTFCTRLCEQETNVKVIQSIMGHSSIETTMDIYADTSTRKNTEAIENLARKLDLF